MNTFWTVTDIDTTKTNSRSKRFGSEESAIKEAEARITKGSSKGVIVLRAIKIVEPEKAPISVSLLVTPPVPDPDEDEEPVRKTGMDMS